MRFRSKHTGRYVKQSYAKRYPGRVVKEQPFEEPEDLGDDATIWEIEIAIDY